MLSKVWDELTYLFPNFNCCTVEAWERISNFYYNWCNHLSMLALKFKWLVKWPQLTSTVYMIRIVWSLSISPISTIRTLLMSSINLARNCAAPPGAHHFWQSTFCQTTATGERHHRSLPFSFSADNLIGSYFRSCARSLCAASFRLPVVRWPGLLLTNT